MSICKNCFHSYVCEQFNEHRECDNKKSHFFNDHFVPVANVVEVVRCKDCKHYDIRNAKCLLHSENADQYSSGFNFEMYSKDFCSYGKLKECEQNGN